MWTITPLKLGITTVWRGGFIMKQGPTASEQFEVPHVAFLLKNLKDEKMRSGDILLCSGGYRNYR